MGQRDRMMSAELKSFEEALRKSGLNKNHDVEQLAFALFRAKDSGSDLETVGPAQGRFSVQKITASFRKLGLKATVVRSNRIYPMPKTGMVVSFADPPTMIFGTPGGGAEVSRCARRPSSQYVDEPGHD